MYRHDETAELRRQLREASESAAELKSELSQKKKLLFEVHKKLEVYERKHGFSFWLREKLSSLGDWFSWNIRNILVVLGVLAACVLLVMGIAWAIEHSERARYAGTITGKEYHPPYTTTNRVCTTDRDGRQSCQDQTIHHPPRWSVDLRFGDNVHGYDIPEDLHDRIEEGHWLCLPDATITDCNRGETTVVYR